MSIRNIRRLLGCVAFAVACMMVGAAITMTVNPAAQAEGTQTVVVTSPFTAAIAQVRGSVVGINNYQMRTPVNFSSHFFGGERMQPEPQEELTSTGSAVVISDKGFVLTNYHVVEAASRLTVTVTTEGSSDVQEHAASLVTYDEKLDAAIVYAPTLGLPAVPLGDSDTLQVGDWAICIGNPLSFTNTSTVGIISALNRTIESEGYDQYGRRETVTNAMIQVDAAINSGNSGGGMFSVSGELMGIPTLKYSGSILSNLFSASVEGIGMCIPINSVKPMIEQVLSGQVTVTEPAAATVTNSQDPELTGKPRLGITISDLNPSNRFVSSGYVPTKGVYVSSVEAGSPAEKAGMQPTDIIVEVNGTIVTSTSELRSIVAGYNAGDTLAVKVFRVPGGLTNNNTIADFEAAGYVDLEVTLAVVDQST